MRKGLDALVEEAESGHTEEDYQEVVDQYKELMRQERLTLWGKADLAAKAATFKRLTHFARATGESFKYMCQLAFVARQYPPYTRAQFPDVKFSIFRLLASRPDRFVQLAKTQKKKTSTEFTKRRKQLYPVEERRLPGWLITNVISNLNKGFKADPEFFKALVSTHFPINDEIKRLYPMVEEFDEVGALALINFAFAPTGDVIALDPDKGFKRFDLDWSD